MLFQIGIKINNLKNYIKRQRPHISPTDRLTRTLSILKVYQSLNQNYFDTTIIFKLH